MCMPLLGKTCPDCGHVADSILELVDVKRTVKIHGEKISVDAKTFRCTRGLHEYFGMGASDYVVDAERVYRETHHYVSPQEMIDFRKKNNLTQQELNDLLGWGSNTLNRYEQGRLQTASHNSYLQMVMNDPSVLKRLIEGNPGIIGKRKAKR